MSDGPSAGGRWDDEDERALQKPRNKMSTQDTPLKPCPFCGSDVHCIEVSGEEASGERFGYWSVECVKCCTQQYATRFCGVHGDEKADAIRHWNTRAETDLERVANRLAEALEKAKAAMLYHSGWTQNFDQTGKELPMTRPTKVAEAASESAAALRDFEELKK